jgi:hypothetical protein
MFDQKYPQTLRWGGTVGASLAWAEFEAALRADVAATETAAEGWGVLLNWAQGVDEMCAAVAPALEDSAGLEDLKNNILELEQRMRELAQWGGGGGFTHPISKFLKTFNKQI